MMEERSHFLLACLPKNKLEDRFKKVGLPYNCFPPLQFYILVALKNKKKKEHAIFTFTLS